ncbi:MAG: hypothetical protein AB8A49_05270 [Prochlorococcus sp.]|jgi:hypothetical protein|nr:hypothetical protein [Prochlorococcaceae cyanobacterium ETNP2_MAG_10]MDP6195862.1 hypothetical protein [Prochlorococcaceae cyanobacterium ETNP18_MAG_17]MDP6321205.1 hypothetical protein [Prochlorococcaceae cyanobacterium ETNP14_MAG_5]MDP6851597.1 hypothetical protein [Prochlorococcaceae cyanobacterium ETNP1_MAG_8]HJL68178.1 hypothetical protein [Prochlorococcaceae cyanobacterium Gl_MAG_24]|tara:strand:+ start:916 stop:1422 length:507 start_codon:yes stop_codon:yes gene_type:complete
MAILRLLFLPFRAPSLLVLFAVAIVMGNHWSILEAAPKSTPGIEAQLFWTVELLQAMVVVVICTMPDLIMRQISMLMAFSRAISLVIVLLLVITAGLYLLHMRVFADVLIIASAVLLARIDLTRIRVVSAPAVMAIALGAILLSGIWLGQTIDLPFQPGFAELFGPNT